MIKRILIGLGGTPYSAAKVRHAIDLARAHNAEVTGVTIFDAARVANVGAVPLGGGPAATELRQWRRHEVEQHLEEAVEQFTGACREAGILSRVIRETGDEFEKFISLWRYHDLTLLGLRGLFEYGILRDIHNAVVQIIAKGIRPILAVAEEYRPVGRAIIAYNGSLESAEAMKRFTQFRLWPNVEFRIICCDMKEEKAQTLLRDAKEYCAAHGIAAETEFLPGSPEKHLLPYAAQCEADLIVMGSTNRSRLARFVLGDLVVHMLQHSRIPLFLTR